MTTALTTSEAEAYRRTWGCYPTGYTEAAGEREITLRRVLARGARHAACFTDRCRHATATDKGCGRALADAPVSP